MAACRQLGFDDPENSTLENKHEVYRITRCVDITIRVSWGIRNPHLGGRGGRRGQRWHHSKERWWFLHCDRCAICNHSAAICDRMSPTLKSTGGESLWSKMSGCSSSSRPLMFVSAESEHPRLTNGEIISEEFQPM